MIHLSPSSITIPFLLVNIFLTISEGAFSSSHAGLIKVSILFVISEVGNAPSVIISNVASFLL